MVDDSIDAATSRRRWPLRAAALLAGIFGALTIRAGALALFGDIDVGAAVPFVLWFNFLAGFAYVAAAFGLWAQRPWAVWLAAAIAAGTAIVFAMFGIHIATGGAFEMRTVWAMALRTAGWCAVVWVGRRLLLDGDRG